MSPISIVTTFLTWAVSSCREVLAVDTSSKTHQKSQLSWWRELWKREFVYHDATIKQIIVHLQNGSKVDDAKEEIRLSHRSPCILYPFHQHSLPTIRIIANLDSQPILFSRFTSIISSESSPPSLLAELREWQQAAHVIACIDTAIAYISSAITEGTDPLTDRICDTMVATILTFVPPQDLRPAQPRPDDRERAMDRRVFYDEPAMQTLISSLNESSRLFLEAAADRERSRLPLVPAHFRGCGFDRDVDGSLIAFDPDYKSHADNSEKFAGGNMPTSDAEKNAFVS